MDKLTGKYDTTIIKLDHLEIDEELTKMIVEEEKTKILYMTIFITLLLLFMNLISW